MSEQVQPETHDPSEPPQGSEEMSLEVLEERIREAEELHRGSAAAWTRPPGTEHG